MFQRASLFLLAVLLSFPAFAQTKLYQITSGGSAQSSDQVVTVRTGTSTTSNTVGTGSLTFTTQAGLSFATGQKITVASSANGANFVAGAVTSYSGTTLIVNSTVIGGSGTFASWNIYGDFLTSGGPYLPLAGGTMSGSIDMGANNITDAVTIAAQNYAFEAPTYYQAAVLNGSSSYVSANDTGLPTGDSPRTIEAWVKVTGTGTVHASGTSGSNTSSIFLIAGGGTPEFFVGTGKFVTVFGASILDGNYHHVAMSYHGSGSVTLYVDGVARTTTGSLSGAINTVLNGTQYMGSNFTVSPQYLTGDEQMVRVYNTDLSATQVASLYNNGIGSFTLPSNISSANLVAQYSMNGNVLDTSSSANNGTAHTISYVANGGIVSSFARTPTKIQYSSSAIQLLDAVNVTGELSVVNSPYTVHIANATSSYALLAQVAGGGQVMLGGNAYSLYAIGQGGGAVTGVDGSLTYSGTLGATSGPGVVGSDGAGNFGSLGTGSYGVKGLAGSSGTAAGDFIDNSFSAEAILGMNISPITTYPAAGYFSGNDGGAQASIGNSSTIYGSFYGTNGDTWTTLNAYNLNTGQDYAIQGMDNTGNSVTIADGTIALQATNGSIFANLVDTNVNAAINALGYCQFNDNFGGTTVVLNSGAYGIEAINNNLSSPDAALVASDWNGNSVTMGDGTNAINFTGPVSADGNTGFNGTCLALPTVTEGIITSC